MWESALRSTLYMTEQARLNSTLISCSAHRGDIGGSGLNLCWKSLTRLRSKGSKNYFDLPVIKPSKSCIEMLASILKSGAKYILRHFSSWRAKRTFSRLTRTTLLLVVISRTYLFIFVILCLATTKLRKPWWKSKGNRISSIGRAALPRARLEVRALPAVRNKKNLITWKF